MSGEEKILEILASMQGQMGAMQAEMKEMHEKIDALAEGQAEIREDLEEVRVSVNTLIGWADRVGSMEAYNMPKL